MKIAQAIPFADLYTASGIKATFQGAPITDLLKEFIPYVFPFAGLLLLAYLFFAGFQFMLSGGDQKGMQEAKGKITHAISGFVVIFVAYWIVQLFGIIFDVAIIKSIF